MNTNKVRDNKTTQSNQHLEKLSSLPDRGNLDAPPFKAPPPEGPGVVFPELVGVAGFDTGVDAFSVCKDNSNI